MSYNVSFGDSVPSPLVERLNKDFNFQISVQVHMQDGDKPRDAAWTDDLSSMPAGSDDGSVAIQDHPTDAPNTGVAGLYMAHDLNWYLAIPYVDICRYVVNGGSVSVYFNITQDATVPNGGVVYKNGMKQITPPAAIPARSSDVWAILVINGSELPIASPTTLGGIRVGDGIGVDRDGIASVVPATQASLGGVSVPADGALSVDAGGALSVNAEKLPTATATTVGVVSVPFNSGLAVNTQGQLKASVLSVAGMTGDVNLTVGDIIGAASIVNPAFQGRVNAPDLLPTKIMPKDATYNQPMLTLARANWALVAETTIGRGAEYMHVGGREYGYGTYRLIGFGYDTTKHDNAPVYIGSEETGISSDASKADFIIATRNSQDPSVPHEVSLRVRSDGQLMAKEGYTPNTDSSLVTKDYIDHHLPAATTTAQGVIQLATLADVTAGTDNSKAVTPELLKSAFTDLLPVATTKRLGGVIVQDGLTVDAQGNLKADVLSVAGKTGAVNLAVDDVSGAAPIKDPVFQGKVDAPDLLPTRVMSKAAGDNQPMLTLARADWAIHAATAIDRSAEYLHVGGREYGPGTYRLIGFGYDTIEHANAPVYIGSQERGLFTDASQADFIIATRNGPDPSIPHQVNLRVGYDGQLLANENYVPGASNSLVTKDYVDHHLPAATTVAQGVIQLATQADVTTGTDNTKAVTPALLKSVAPAPATQASPGIIQLATQAEVTAGTDNSKAVTPALLKSATADLLPIATTNRLGGVIVQDGLTVDGQGRLKADVLSVAGRTGNVVLNVDDVSGAAPIKDPAFQGRVDAPDLLPTKVMSKQGSDNQPMLTLARSNAAIAAAKDIGRSAEYMHVGGREYGYGSYRLVGFGYDTAKQDNAPVYIGSQETGNSSDASKADFIIATRNSDDPTVPHEVSLRIRSDGQLMAKEGYAPSTDSSLVTRDYIDRHLPVASTSKQGIIQLATQADVTAGTDNSKAVTPALLKAARPSLATHTSAGIVQLATDTQVMAGQDDSTAITPRGLKEYVDTKLGSQNVASVMHCALMTPILYSLTAPFDCWVEVLGNAYAEYPEFAGESTTYDYVIDGHRTGSTATLGRFDGVITTSFKQYRVNKGSLVQLIMGDGNNPFFKLWYRVAVTFVLHGL